MNVFKKCLKKQFGKEGYNLYIEMCEEEIFHNGPTSDRIEEKEVFKSMYQELSVKSEEYIREKTEYLTSTLYKAFQIGKSFTSVFLFYMVANVVILSLELNYFVTCISITLMGVCFIYKLIEYLVNRYCFEDAYLIMIYKSVLEKLAGTTIEG